ncbi:MAG: hypothetical protein ACLQE9_00485 [Roseiarcus sp.]
MEKRKVADTRRREAIRRGDFGRENCGRALAVACSIPGFEAEL